MNDNGDTAITVERHAATIAEELLANRRYYGWLTRTGQTANLTIHIDRTPR